MAVEPYPMYLSIGGLRTAQEAWDFITDVESSDYARQISGDGNSQFTLRRERGFVVSEPEVGFDELYDVGHERLNDLANAIDRFTRPTLAIMARTSPSANDVEWWFFGWIEVDEDLEPV